jgi:aryl-alcohol dehydrogenase-like predicted oxidoreductase/Pyruvate/2-oxoacid:ferredoxin oxidoreductase delta subunit
MKNIILGNTGITVSELCFGALPIGPTQKDMPPDAAADVIAHALRSGVTFIDTAQLYQTYPHIRRAMELTGIRPVISTKAPYADYAGMKAAVEEALRELDVEYIDIFMLHAARVGDDVFGQRRGAVECLQEYKGRGIVKAVGISTHAAPVVRLAAEQSGIDVVFPLLNMTGMGILRGTRDEMEAAVNLCHERGKGVFLMKALAGGNLINDYVSAMDYVKRFSGGRFATAMGIVSRNEVDINVRYFNGDDVTGMLPQGHCSVKEFVVLDGICVRCGRCVEACHSGAVTMDATRAFIDNGKCIKCGYCVAACNTFCIRMV